MKTWMFMPDGDGNPHIVDLVSPTTNLRQEAQMFDDPDSKVTFWLYNK